MNTMKKAGKRFSANFDEAANLCKACDDYILGGYLILQDLLKERVAEGDTFDPNDFTALSLIS